MKKIANFIVQHNKLLLIIFVILTIVCAVCSRSVEINYDMTKYLPDDSRMKQGMDIMNEEFSQGNDETSIRVMFTGLSDSEKDDLKDTLDDIKYVESVDYDKGSEDYNKDEYTKYVVTTDHEYGSKEEKAVEASLQELLDKNEAVMVVDDMAARSIPTTALLLAFGILIVILIIMSNSWIEPLLFVITIFMAIFMNLGTNIFLGTISNTTSSICSILQLVLSMDYSIILMNRYHQELAKTPDKKQAMKTAWQSAFSSIFSSSLTTVVGLLALVFMSFKIGRDLGIVLSKGVLLSVICVLTVLPGLILLFTPVILKTKKKVPVIPTKKLAGFSFKSRKFVTAFFAVLFIAVFILQQGTELVYNIKSTDDIAEVFPKQDSVVLLYDNKDEAAIAEYTEKLLKNPYVKNITSYSETIAKPCTVEELSDKLKDASSETELSEEMLSILYYHYSKGGKTRSMTAGDFITFLADDVVSNDTFADELPKDTKDNIKNLKKFASAEKMKKPMTDSQLADFLDIEEKQCQKIMLYYYIQNDRTPSESLTVPEFFSYVVDDLASNEDYSSVFDSANLSSVKDIQKYTDSYQMTRSISYGEMASMLGIDSSTARLLYANYFANQSGYSSGKMTVTELVKFLKNDVAGNKAFSSKLGKDTAKQINTLSKFTDKATITKPMTAKELSALFGISESTISQMFLLDSSNIKGKTMTLKGFTDFILSDVIDNKAYSSYFNDSTKSQLTTMNKVLTAAEAGTQLTYAQIAAMTGLDKATVKQLYGVYFQSQDVDSKTMSLSDFTGFMVNTVLKNPTYSAKFDEAAQAKIKSLHALVSSAAAKTKYNASGIASALNIKKDVVKQVFALKFTDKNKTMTPQKFVSFVLNDVLTNKTYASKLDSSTKSSLTLLNKVMNAVISGEKHDASSAAKLLGMDKSTMKLLYAYKKVVSGSDKVSVQTMVNYLVNNNSSVLGSDMSSKLKKLQKIINASVAGNSCSYSEMADIVGIESDNIRKLYLIHESEKTDTSSWKLSVQTAVDFLSKELKDNDTLAENLDTDSLDKIDSAKALVDAVVSQKEYTPDGLYDIIKDFSDEMTAEKLKLIYLYHDSQLYGDKNLKLSMKELVNYIVTDLFENKAFADILSDETKDNILDVQNALNEAQEKLVGKNYSRLILSVTDLEDMSNIEEFFSGLNSDLGERLDGEFYLIGDSSMSYEMSHRFDSELLLITLLTALAIFIVVALTFRNLALPMILVLIVQCGVYITVSIIGLQGGGLYYLTLLMVECILMGSTIDYGILFSSYYREGRKTINIKDTLISAYRGSIETIMTSGSIMIIVTGVLSFYFPDPSTAQICRNISIGALCASLLILFILPGILATFDRFVIPKKIRTATDKLLNQK